MASIFKPTKDLSKDELESIWAIYEKVYVQADIPSLEKEQWYESVLKPFCYNNKQKWVQEFSADNNSIDGYTLFSEPEPFREKNITKIFQQGIGNIQTSRSEAFIDMNKELSKYTKENNCACIAEIGVKHDYVQGLLKLAGFEYIQDEKLGKDITQTMLKHINFLISSTDKGILLRRNTQLVRDYQAHVLTNAEF